MYRIYEGWTAYSLFVVDSVLSAYSRTDHWPDLLAFGLPIAVLFGVDLLQPRWAALLVFFALGAPLVWFLASMVRVYLLHHRR